MKIDEIEVYGYLGLKGTIPCKRVLIVENGGLFPALVSFKDGEMLTFYRGTPDHMGANSNISMKRSTDGGLSWGEPLIITAEEDDRNPAVGIIEPSTVVMLYTSRKQSAEKDNVWSVKYRRSNDRGRSWGPAKDVRGPAGYTLCSPGGGSNLLPAPDGLIGNVFGLKGGSQYNKQLISEWIGLPMSYFADADMWKQSNPMIDGGSDETDFFRTKDGQLGAIIRTGGVRINGCYVRYCIGNEWTKPVQSFPDGLHPARITSLSQGRLQQDRFIATIGRRRYPYGAQVMLTRDGCRTWDWDNQFLIADNCGKGEQRGDNGYASSTILKGEYVYTVWYKNISDAPYFPGTGEKYTLEGARYLLNDLLRQA